MNQNHEELEARITALLLGELTDEEAAALRREMEARPELKALEARLKFTIGLVEEAVGSQPAELAAPEGLKLGDEKRQKLLAAFKTVKAPEFKERRFDYSTWAALAAMIVLLLAFGAAMLPGAIMARGRTSSQPQKVTLLRDEDLQESVAAEMATAAVATPQPSEAKAKNEDVRFYYRFSDDAKKSDGLTRGWDASAGERVNIELPKLEARDEIAQRRSGGAGGFGGGGGRGGSSRGFGTTENFFEQTRPEGRSLGLTPTPPPANSTPAALPSGGVAGNLWAANPGLIKGTAANGPVTSLASQSSRGVNEEVRDMALVPFDVAGVPATTAVTGLAVEEGKPALADRFSDFSAINRSASAAAEPVDKEVALGFMVAPGQSAGKPVTVVGGAEAPSLGDRPVLGREFATGSKDARTEVEESRRKLGELAEKAPARPMPKPAPADEFGAKKSIDQLSERQRGQRASEEKEVVEKDLDDMAAVKQQEENVANRGRLSYLKLPAVRELERLSRAAVEETTARRPVSSAAVPQPEVATSENNFSTFSLNVSDVSFKLAAASLEKGQMPEPATVRSEEFINAFDYRDPAPAGSAPLAFAWERSRYPFAHDRDLLRFSVKTAASGREAGRPLNLVLLLDNSGSMERADRVRIIQECMRVLGGQLQAADKVSVVTFARTARLWVDGLPGSAAGELPARVGTLAPEGGTNLEEAMRVAYETAARHFATNGINRVVLLTDGAANLGDVQPETLKKKVEAQRKAGIALDCFGIGWEGLNDDLLEQLSRNGDGRYGFVNTPEAATAEFARQLAGALKVAASDVKVQVEFNPKRATVFRQIGYAKHQLTKEQFRDNTVDAAEIGAAEAGNALYLVQTNPRGEGPIATVRARFKVPGTSDYREHAWDVPYEGGSKTLEESSAAMRLAAAASAFSEWLTGSPYAAEVTPDKLLGLMGNVPEAFANDGRPKQLEWMIRQAKSIAGK